MVATVLAVLGVLAIPHDSGPKEPTYKGQKLRKWVALQATFPASEDERHEASAALEAMGSNSIPFLVQWMDYQPQRWRQKLSANTLRVLPFLRSFPSIFERIADSERGILACGSYLVLDELKPPAAAVTNQLCRMLLQTRSTVNCASAPPVMPLITPVAWTFRQLSQRWPIPSLAPDPKNLGRRPYRRLTAIGTRAPEHFFAAPPTTVLIGL